ncbi:MAG: flagellar hook-basal body complex protein [Deinococcus-Thermus bacterium]|jgi:flagellar hook protein FlgE|nr:flagellar hook-basal body complex protein [Deinococcota bacterium]
MTISSSLNAGVSGLASNASRLSTISDNIANSNTVGYKRAETSFRSLVTSPGAGTYTAGGTSVVTSRLIDQESGLRTTSNSTDLAVRGRGFLPVTSESSLASPLPNYPLNLATTGSFRTDENGYLVNDSGFVLMGWPAAADGTIPDFARDTGDGLRPVQINVNQATGEPTTEVSLGLNVPATETEFDPSGAPVEPFVLPVEYFDNLGRSQTLGMEFTPSQPAAAGDPATNVWNLTIRDSASTSANDGSGAIVGLFRIEFNTDRTNGGTIASVTATDTYEDGTTLGAGDLPASLGGGAGTDWAWDAANGELSVNVGATDNAATGVLGGSVSLNIGAPNEPGKLTQYSDSFSPNFIGKDGSPVGSLQNVEVDRNGFVKANFDNGLTRTVYQIPLVDMPNPNGLVPQDGQTYVPSTESGSFFLWQAGEGATGDIVSYALEESATDVAGELTALIETQRAYSSNAKVIQTVDEMLQETTNIKR